MSRLKMFNNSNKYEKN